ERRNGVELHAGLEIGPLVDYALKPRRLGLILVRKGAHSVGIAEGPRVVVSRTGRHYVQGRTAAGGQSQQRFARRREQQGRQALNRAADDILDVLGQIGRASCRERGSISVAAGSPAKDRDA